VIQLDSEHLRVLHAYALAETGGADGVRDEALLEAAAAAPYAGFSGTKFYPTIEAKAARLAFGIISNHPFVDGNKRVGMLAMLTLLGINNITLTFTDAELEALGLGVADGTIATDEIQSWIEAHEISAD
jgi:death-on-curing protein